MFFKSTEEVPAFIAGDATYLRELFHPKNDGIESHYSLVHAEIAVGEQSYPHTLQAQAELYYILEGEGMMYVAEEKRSVQVGDLVLVNVGEKQFVVNTGTQPLRFLCIVSPPWSAADEVILEVPTDD
jgi:mannose-6-phosphate isomerase-like protein (cupin superfamily)